MEILKLINAVVVLLFGACFLYQTLYIPAAWLKKRKKPAPTDMRNHYAVLVCARNEEEVITGLIGSIRRQTYDAQKLHIFVMADNCTDRTAEVARNAGAVVYERFDTTHVGKGYALDCLLKHLAEDYPAGFDGYFVFDADNVLRDDYVEQMDRMLCAGHDVITSYRNSKNYGTNWISTGYSLAFMRESRYMQNARYLLGTSCSVTGTGFLFSRRIAGELKGWPYFTLSEDTQFSVDQIVKGRKIAFCADAEFYDEQPVTFTQSWHQRMRWAHGKIQIFKGYGKPLFRGMLHGSFSCYDLLMMQIPTWIPTLYSLISTALIIILDGCGGGSVEDDLASIGAILGGLYSGMFVIGGITTVTEWKRIRTTTARKIVYAFTFPVFMATYIPISIAALFINPGWKPIKHSAAFNMPDKREAV